MKYTQGVKKDFEAIRDKYADSLMEKGAGYIASDYITLTDGQMKAAEHGAVAVLTPTLDFMAAVKEESDILGLFLDYIKRNFILIDRKRTRCSEEMAVVAAIGAGDFIDNEKTLADYYGIDLKEAEQERSELLESIRNTHGEDRKDG